MNVFNISRTREHECKALLFPSYLFFFFSSLQNVIFSTELAQKRSESTDSRLITIISTKSTATLDRECKGTRAVIRFTGNPFIYTFICWHVKSIHPRISIPNYALNIFLSLFICYYDKSLPFDRENAFIAFTLDIPIDWKMHAICILCQSQFKTISKHTQTCMKSRLRSYPVFVCRTKI